MLVLFIDGNAYDKFCGPCIVHTIYRIYTSHVLYQKEIRLQIHKIVENAPKEIIDDSQPYNRILFFDSVN